MYIARTMNWGKIHIKLFGKFISIDNLEAGGYLNVYTHKVCAYLYEDIGRYVCT